MSVTKEVWVVDDDESIRWVLERALSREGFAVRSFVRVPDVLAALEISAPQALLSDIRMPGTSGLRLLEQIRARHPGLPVIIMTAYTDLDSAVAAFQGGAFEYLAKPFDLAQALELVRRAVHERELEGVEEPEPPTQDMLGQAPAMQEVFRAIGRLAQSAVTVLITGESGAGKEVIARALHQHSVRAAYPFVALNMAAIPRELLESELFGHERGAFTGAQALRRGRFEQAEQGTLFLDEIGDMPAEMQTRLLRVLSDGHFYRVGGQQSIRANVRVIAATHQNLEERVRLGLFREDLYHRLNVIRLRLPPLRERREDIGLLARHFLVRSAAELGGEPKRLSAGALEVLLRFGWPGNVRQLENVCNWLTVMAPGQVISVADLPLEVRTSEIRTAEPSTVHPDRHLSRTVNRYEGDTAFVADPYAIGRSGGRNSGPEESWHRSADVESGRCDLVGTAVSARPPNSVELSEEGCSATPSFSGSNVKAGNMAISSAHRYEPSGLGGLSDGGIQGSGHSPGGARDNLHEQPGAGLGRMATTEAAQRHSAQPPWQDLLAHAVMRMLEEDARRRPELSPLGAEVPGLEGTAAEAAPDATDRSGVMAELSRQFEATLIRTALHYTRGRRVEAAQRLGIGRNTITRKIQELDLAPRRGRT